MRTEFAGIRIELLYYFYNGLAVDRSASRETPTRPSSRESTAEHKIIVSVMLLVDTIVYKVSELIARS